MKVSIVMPVYNSGKFIQQTLVSVEAQTYKDWELIVVDDGSDDNSMQVVEAFRQRHSTQCTITHSSQPRSGAAACRNIGLKHATGDFVLFFDSDDLLESFCLQQRVDVMKADTSLDWAVFNQYAWYPEQQPPFILYNKKISSREEAIKCFLQMQSAWQTMAVLWKREAIEKLKGFDEALYFMEDPDLHLRALLEAELTVAFKTDLPADCFYRMPVMTADKAEQFYANSIASRFGFLKKLFQWLPQKVQPQVMLQYCKHIRTGFLDFAKVMLLARLTQFQQQFDEIVKLLIVKNVLNDADVLRLQFASSVYTSRSKFITALRLRGIAHRLL